MKTNQWLLATLNLAKQGKGFCAPNPAVGAVAVKNNQVIARGYHHGAGKPHAEVEVLKNLGEAARGADLYVTLEPCCHYGRTPPCTDLIIQSGIHAVYYAYRDPNPVVDGAGAEKLVAAGVKVTHVPLKEIDDFYRGYRYWLRTQQPWVTAKLAVSLDGKIAGKNGEPVVLTGDECQQFTHQQRLYADAILTTARTVIHDHAQLNVRLGVSKPIAKPIYILDRHLRLPTDLPVVRTGAPITLFYADADENRPSELAQHGIRCIRMPCIGDLLDLYHVLTFIGGEDGIHELWVEAGGRLFASLLTKRLINQAYWYLSPKWLGNEATAAFAGSCDVLLGASGVKWCQAGQDVIGSWTYG